MNANKSRPALLAAIVPAVITPCVLLLSRTHGPIFGLSPEFLEGFAIGLAIVLLAASIVMLHRQRGK